MISKICFGEGPSKPECGSCLQCEGCMNQVAGWGVGTLAAQMERYAAVYDALTKNMTPDDLEILMEMLETGGYTASTAADYCSVRGIIVSEVQLVAERNMEYKAREYLKSLRQAHPEIWNVYVRLIEATEPKAVGMN